MTKKILLILLLFLIFLILLWLISFNPKKTKTEKKEDQLNMNYDIKITIANDILLLKLENNSATRSLINKLQTQDLTISTTFYGGFEQVGDLGFSLPQSNQNLTTKPGDLVLYNGDKISLFFNSNTWSYTPLGTVINKTPEELQTILNKDSLNLTISLKTS